MGGNASLTIKGLEAGYGEVPVLMGIDIKIDEKEMVAIVGPNGAGKSTLLRCISGLIERRAGEIWFLNRKIDELNCDDIVKLGIIYCPEGGKVFPEMNVEDNLLIGGYLQRRIERIKADGPRLSFIPPFAGKEKSTRRDAERRRETNGLSRVIPDVETKTFHDG